MKNFIVVVLLTCLFQKLEAQVVFCPPGAEWHYSFWDYYPSNTIKNEQIKYVRDSIVDNETVKVLKHDKRLFKKYNGCPSFPGVPYRFVTIIKQKGDTVLFRNLTTNQTWQILYNFAALPGQSWQNTLTTLPTYSPFPTYQVTVTVDSVKNILVNNFSLRRLYVKYVSQFGVEKVFIDERMGCSLFLFNFYNSHWTTGCGDVFENFLCYTDNAFGTKQMSDKPCNYTDALGINEDPYQNNKIKIFPNPTRDFFSVNISHELSNKENNVKIKDLFGRTIKQLTIAGTDSELIKIDIADLAQGVYILGISHEGTVMYSGKLVKGE